MLDNILYDIDRENAIFAREVEYAREAAIEDIEEGRMEMVDPAFDCTTREEVEEIRELAESFPDDYTEEEEAELDRILTAEKDLTFDQMIGL